MKSIRVMTAAWALAVLLAAQGASALVIVKQVDTDGRISYTDSPDPDAVIVAQYTASPAQYVASPEPPQEQLTPPETRQAAPAYRQSDVESALSNMTRMSSARAAAIDASEAARRMRWEQENAWRRAQSPSKLLIANESPAHAGNHSTGIKFPAGERAGIPGLIISIVLYLVFAIGLGCMAHVSVRIIMRGLLPIARYVRRYHGKIRAAQQSTHVPSS